MRSHPIRPAPFASVVLLLAVACGPASTLPASDESTDESNDEEEERVQLERPRRERPRALVTAPTGVDEVTRVIQDEIFPVSVTLDESTVLCSSADYAATFLKVLIPDIAQVTLFDHRNFAVAAPCIAAGECSDELNPSTILDAGGNGEIVAPLRVMLTGIYVVNHDAQTCTVRLREDLSTVIRGVEFTHAREGFVSERAVEDCL